MKRTYTILIAVVSFLTFNAFVVLSPTGKAGVSGAPGETTCATSSCHNSFTLNSGPGSMSVTSDIPNWEYTPGQQYTINVKIEHAGRSLFGFCTEILKADGANSGTLAITDAIKTQLMNITVQSKLRKSVTHKSNGGAEPDSALFSFAWTAPAAGSGNATIYFAGNACNANSSPAGDYVYSGSQIITESLTSGVNHSKISKLHVYPNPVKDRVNFNYSLKEAGTVKVQLYSLDGKLIKELSYESMAGEQNYSFPTDETLARGTYLLSISGKNISSVAKVFVE